MALSSGNTPMSRAWRSEAVAGCSLLTVALLLGWAAGSIYTAMMLALLLYLLRLLQNLYALSRWVQRPKKEELPEPGGVWGEVFEQILDMQRRNRKRKRRLAGILSEFQASTAALPDGAVVLSSRGQIVWFNNAAQALLGLRVPQDVGQRVPNLVRHPAFTSYFDRAEFNSDVEVPSPINPEITLSFRVIPYGDGQRLLIVRDVSEILRMETARRDFVSNASHELRTPLTVLRGYLDMMEGDSGEGGRLQAWQAPLTEMRAQAGRMEALISDMLKLARLEADVVQTRQDLVDMPRVLADVTEAGKGLSRGRHQITAEIEPGLQIYGRESELHSVASNLLSNAVQYTPEGGQIALRWWSNEEGAHLSVRDTGIGIAPQDLSRLTERFYRVDVGRSRDQGGTGLGLAITKHALEHHEGQLQVDSKLTSGTTFTCTFPPHRRHQRAALAANS